jgi:SM-20-related protein
MQVYSDEQILPLGGDGRLAAAMAIFKAEGLVLWEQAFDTDTCQKYRSQLQKFDNEGQFVAAGIGKGQQKNILTRIRSDRICWFPDEVLSLHFSEFYRQLGEIMAYMNRYFYMGLRRFEIHGAIYGPGQHYERHLDQHRHSSERVVTAVFYLNESWSPAEGGTLRVFKENGEVLTEVLPLAGRLLLFESARYEHEVLVSHRDRYSLTGWFRRDAPVS